MTTTPGGDRPAAARAGSDAADERLDLAERLRILVERGHDLVYRYRFVPERGFDYVSPSATAMTGYTPEDHYADPDLGFKLVHPDDRPLLEAAGAGSVTGPLVLRWVRRDGSILWTEQHNTPVVDADGKLVAIEGTARDVTAREETLHALRASEARFRTLLERVDLIAFVLDPTGLVTFANSAFLGAVRLGPGGANGRDWFESFVAPEERDALRAVIGADLVAGRVNRAVVTDLVASDGSRRLTHLHVIGLPGRDGTLSALAAIGDDLTAIDEQAARSARLAAAIEQTSDAVLITDADANIEYVNPAFERVTGYTLDEVRGQNPRILKSGRQSDRFYRRMWRTLASGAPWRGELVNRRRDGALFVEEASITPIRGRDGRVEAYVGVKRDVTRLRELGGELATERRIHEQLAAAVSALATGPTLEVTAERITEVAMTVPGIVIASVILMSEQDAGRLAAVASDLGEIARAGDRLDRTRTAYLRERAARGPWVEAWRPTADDGDLARMLHTAGLRAALYAPIGNGRIHALLALGAAGPDALRTLARRMPWAMELAALAAGLLRSQAEARFVADEAGARVRSIIAEQAFRPVFQPIVELGTGHPVGFEALTRFTVGTAPDRVFSDAWASGLGIDLETATLQAAISTARDLPEDAWLSVNVSPAYVLDDHRLARLVAAADRPVVLEITEHAPVDDYGALRTALAGVRSRARIAVDDAGAGVANFGHLVELAPDFVKADIGLVRGVDADPARRAMIAGLRHFVQEIGGWLIAEGIETDAERDALLGLDLRYGQGYLLGRPAEARAWR